MGHYHGPYWYLLIKVVQLEGEVSSIIYQLCLIDTYLPTCVLSYMHFTHFASNETVREHFKISIICKVNHYSCVCDEGCYFSAVNSLYVLWWD